MVVVIVLIVVEVVALDVVGLVVEVVALELIVVVVSSVGCSMHPVNKISKHNTTILKENVFENSFIMLLFCVEH